MRNACGTFLAVLLTLLLSLPAEAQTGAQQAIEPWPEGAWAQNRPSLQLWDTHTTGVDEGVKLQLFETSSRYRLDPDDDRSPMLGYDAFIMRLRSDDPVLPPRLVDVSLGTTFMLRDEPDWSIALPLGVGFAGTQPFSDSRAWYGRASILSFHRLDERSQLMLGLDYHGNRTIFPDIPLPGVAYIRQFSDELTLTLGVPYSNVRWQPDDRWNISVSYSPTIDVNVDVDVQYQLTEAWSLFGAFENQRRAFHRKDDDRHRRLFFQQRRAEAGIRWQAFENVELLAAGGYTFSGKLERGFDTRDTDTLRRFGDSPYFRLGLSTAF
ncbi:MAG: DUF6268 family outer membrane beta-barrel protein [Phycisphaeraceae bacterium]